MNTLWIVIPLLLIWDSWCQLYCSAVGL
uniref:Uncharacterized protein n=1 Tax=Anguilla anguilla TaxID=7936 RepID=A0A0E9TAZ4_ANGAN